MMIGFKMGKLFGTSHMQDTTYTYPAEVDVNGNLIEDDWLTYQMTENKYNYSSLTYSLDMRFKIFRFTLDRHFF